MEFCYPGVCAKCREQCPSGQLLCGGCLTRLEELESRPACVLCARPLSTPDAPCPFCLSHGIRPFRRLAALALFEEPLKTLVHLFKYNRRWPVAEQLADRALARERFLALVDACDVLVPVPLHRLKQIQRGYNQAEVIARRIGACRGKPVHRALIRVRNTATQTHLESQQQRHENIRGAFAIARPRALEGRRVLLVDDVMTSSATLHEAARTAATANPASLSAIVLAVADPKGRKFEAI